jgi:NAD(P)-dependent dehydrogenase (short-subunit alcohol dehydrogenase family)
MNPLGNKALHGKTAVITGAGSGIGLEFAHITARHGMQRVMVDFHQASRDADRFTRERALLTAKFTIGRISTRVTEENIQLPGGIGMTWEIQRSHHVKRQVMIDHQLAAADHHLARYIALNEEN